MSMDERVLVIPTQRFMAAGYFHGFRRAEESYRRVILDPAAFEFRPRSEVETDPAFKQLIPYVVLQYGNDLFHYRRGSAGTETRLQALRSIGIGGHVSETDARDGEDLYTAGMRREVREEVALECGWNEHHLGFINDDRTPVGRVHLGVIHLFELNAPRARAREAALAEAGFAPLAELLAEADRFETWSQFVLEELKRGM
jgi:predicted NUDIX family phosphoesterase